jgi:hypothetical protein
LLCLRRHLASHTIDRRLELREHALDTILRGLLRLRRLGAPHARRAGMLELKEGLRKLAFERLCQCFDVVQSLSEERHLARPRQRTRLRARRRNGSLRRY